MAAMKRTLTGVLALVLAASALVAAQQAAPTSARGRAAADRPYTPPRTPWGEPDLQGTWPSTAGVPFMRDPRFGTRNVLTEAEYQERQAQLTRQLALDQADFDLEKAAATQGDAVNGPMQAPPHWQERGKSHYQASLLVDPPDGRMPAFTPEAQRRQDALREEAKWRGQAYLQGNVADSYTDRNHFERCLSRGFAGSMLPAIYNNGNRIVQAPGMVAFVNEMIHETRVIYTDGRPHVNGRITMWMGDSRGRWDGDTLVVETTNIGGFAIIGNSRHSDAIRISERFTRVSDNVIEYRMTVEDPKTWTAPWTLQLPFSRDESYGFYEYACHEGNYGMFNLLSAARAAEKEQK